MYIVEVSESLFDNNEGFNDHWRTLEGEDFDNNIT